MDDDTVRSLILPKLEGVHRRAGYWMARCPAHEDNEASLTVTPGKDQPVLLKCFAGCAVEDIVMAMGLSMADLSKPRDQRGEWTPHGEAIAIYDYVDEEGTLLFQVCRTAAKQFPQRVPDSSKQSGYRWGTKGVRRVLYRLPKIIEAIADGDVIHICEGEKDVQAIESLGGVATCPPGGSNASVWLSEYTPYFEGAIVRIVADKDKAGYAHARRVFAQLEPVAAAVEIIEAAEGKDAADHMAAGKTLADFQILKQAGDDTPDLAPDLYQFIGTSDPPVDWVVKDLLERSDRMIWTSREGMGKSTITRQIAVCSAAGRHPFYGYVIDPCRVLFIDCENPHRKSRRHFRELAVTAQKQAAPVGDGMLRLIHRPEGINLCDPDEAEWLVERVTAHKPDLLCIGPLYRLHAVDANEETAARAIVTALDLARVKADCALWVEAHSPHGEELRPIGSSLFRRWPDFGMGMKPAVVKGSEATRRLMQVESWRGPREERKWPNRLRWGNAGEWPWVPVQVEPEQRGWWQDP